MEKGTAEADASQAGRNGASVTLIWTEWATGHVSGHKLMARPADPSSVEALEDLQWIWTEEEQGHKMFKNTC